MDPQRHKVNEAIQRLLVARSTGQRLLEKMQDEARVVDRETEARRYDRVASSDRRMAALLEQKAEAYRRRADDAEAIHFFLQDNPDLLEDDA